MIYHLIYMVNRCCSAPCVRASVWDPFCGALWSPSTGLSYSNSAIHPVCEWEPGIPCTLLCDPPARVLFITCPCFPMYVNERPGLPWCRSVVSQFKYELQHSCIPTHARMACDSDLWCAKEDPNDAFTAVISVWERRQGFRMCCCVKSHDRRELQYLHRYIMC